MNTIGRDYLTAISSYEERYREACGGDSWRLTYHIMPPVGWLNDPNGLGYFNGTYHVYFQYSPFSPEGGMKCWGLYTSPDLVKWEYQGVKLCPDEPFDVHGVYSGSALVENGEMYLFYTGNVKKTGDYDYVTDGRESHTICVKTSDGLAYGEKKRVMGREDYGDGLTCHVRDPKVWKEDGCYYMVQGARTLENRGEVLVFSSPDLKRWKRINVIRSHEPLGYMWECPDLFLLDGRRVLCFSPQGVDAKGDAFQNVYQSGCCFLDGDFRGEYSLGEFLELDHGFDYYAPQSFQAPDGRRIQIGWMGLPDIEGIYENPTVGRGWQHAMTIPRELTVRDGKLCQNPVREMESLRRTQVDFAAEGVKTMEVTGVFELAFSRRLSDREFCLTIDNGLSLSYRPPEKRFEMRFLDESGAGREVRRTQLELLEDIRVFVDGSSAEVFLNGGREVFTTRFYPRSQNHRLTIRSQDGTGSIWKIG